MCLIYYIIHVYIYFFFLLISLLSLSFCVCLLAFFFFFFSSRDLVFISTFMLLCLELEKFSLFAQYQVQSPTHSTHRTTRAQTYTSLIIPRVSKSAGVKSPAFFSTLLWNELPSDLRSLSSVHSFRQKLMVYLDSL